VTSEEGYEKILRAMQDDMGGLGNYSACLFRVRPEMGFCGRRFWI
jgi:hypothetical protein